MDTAISPTLQATLKTNRIVAVGPVVAIVVPLSVTMPIVLPEPLAGDLLRKYAQLDALDERFGFKRFSFQDWVIERLKDAAYPAYPDELAEAHG